MKDPVTGRRLQPSFTVPAAQAKQETERVRSELALGRYQGTSATFGDLLDKALRVHVPTLAPTAQDTFKNYAKYLRPPRGYPLRKLEEHPEIVEEFYAAGIPAIRGNGKFLKPMSIRHVHWVLAQAFHAGKRWRWIRHDPSQEIKLPPLETREPESPPVDAVRALMAAAGDIEPAFPLFIRLAAIAGGRRGELHAIRFTDVDAKRGVIELRRNYVRAGGVWVEKATTKTGRSRYIDIDATSVALIHEQRERLEELARAAGCNLPDDAFLFSKEPTAPPLGAPRRPPGGTSGCARGSAFPPPGSQISGTS